MSLGTRCPGPTFSPGPAVQASDPTEDLHPACCRADPSAGLGLTWCPGCLGTAGSGHGAEVGAHPWPPGAHRKEREPRRVLSIPWSPPSLRLCLTLPRPSTPPHHPPCPPQYPASGLLNCLSTSTHSPTHPPTSQPRPRPSDSVALLWPLKPRNAQAGGGGRIRWHSGGGRAVWPPRAQNILPSLPSASLTGARPMPRPIPWGKSAWLGSQAPFLCWEEAWAFSSCSPCHPPLAGWLSAGSG